MGRNYYYFVAGLPDLFIDQERKDFNLLRVKEEAMEFLHPSDYSLVELLYLTYDNENILNHLHNRKLNFNTLGKFPEEMYEEFEENLNEFPSYVAKFHNFIKGNQAEDEEQDEERTLFDSEQTPKNNEVKFYELFYAYINSMGNQFLSNWFQFLRNFNNILTAISCRNMGISSQNQLIGNGVVVEALNRSQAPDFGLKQEVEYIEALLQITEVTSIIERERRLDMLKWDMADEMSTFDYFNINRILAFFIKAGIVHRWMKLDPKVGAELFQKLTTELKESYTLPKEFSK